MIMFLSFQIEALEGKIKSEMATLKEKMRTMEEEIQVNDFYAFSNVCLRHEKLIRSTPILMP